MPEPRLNQSITDNKMLVDEKEKLFQTIVPKGFLPRKLHEVSEGLRGAAVIKNRGKVTSFLRGVFDFFPEEYLDKLSGRELMGLILYYFNNEASWDHFLTIYKVNHEVENNPRGELLKELVIRNYYAEYLLRKLPRRIQEELIEEEEEYEISRLEKLHAKRKSLGVPILLGFHTSPGPLVGNSLVGVGSGIQTNIDLVTGEKKEVLGAKFFTFSPQKLYTSSGIQMRYLTFIEVNKDLLSKVYNQNTAAFSRANLSIIDDDLKNLELTAEVVSEFGFDFVQY